MTDSNPIRVQCRDLSIGYRYDRPVLKGLDLDVVPGDVLAIIGPNGSGKTTLMLTLMGVLEPLGGEVSIAGLPPSEYRRRNGFGYLAEDTQMPDGWRCDGILALAATAAGSGSDVANALSLAGVDYATNLRVGTLSKGMRRRLALAVALMGSARLLMLDEPESGLDPRQRHHLRRRIRALRASMTILVASHDLGELALMSDSVLLVDQGRGRLVEPPDGEFTRDFLEREFLGLGVAAS